jgi:autotransporter adhesin
MATSGSVVLLNEVLGAAVSAQTPGGVVSVPVGRMESLVLVAIFTRAGGGTTTKAWVQTSFDGGATWMDIHNFAFTTSTATSAVHLTDAAVTSPATPADGTTADNTAVNGFLGPLLRVKLTTTGTYTGASSIVIHAYAK